jgi:hypothetical protein
VGVCPLPQLFDAWVYARSLPVFSFGFAPLATLKTCRVDKLGRSASHGPAVWGLWYPARLVLPETHPDALLQAQAEIRDLQAAIAEMRKALELLSTEKQQAVQQATSEAALEAAHLRETISAMRDQMETLQYQKQSALQQAAADAHNDIQQFTATIRSLRDQMEQMRESHATELQEMRRDMRDRHHLLEETIALLREQLEACHRVA